MFKKLVTGAGCFVFGTWLWASGASAQRNTRPPEVPPTSPPTEATPPETAPPDIVTPPSRTASPPDVPAPPPLQAPAQKPQRISAGTVVDPAPAAPAPVARPAPARLPFTGAGDETLPLAGAAIALGGLALMAGQPRRPVPPTGPAGLVHSEDAAAKPSDPDRGDDDGLPDRRLPR